MRIHAERIFLPALLLTWALSHAALVAGETKATNKTKATPSSAEQIRKILDQPVTLDFSGQSLMEAFQHVREKARVEINLDQVALTIVGVNVEDNGEQPIVLKSQGGKLGSALRKLLARHQLTYVIFEDSLLITTPELAAQRQMRQRVSVDVADRPLGGVLRDLARNYAFNLVIDPKLGKLGDNAVTLRLESTTLETSVRLLAEFAGLKAVRFDNVVLITTEERADKLRKEDRDAQPAGPDEPGARPGAAAALAVPGALGIAGPAFKAVPLPPANDPVAPPPIVQPAPNNPPAPPAAPAKKE